MHQHHGMLQGIICHQGQLELAGFKAAVQLRNEGWYGRRKRGYLKLSDVKRVCQDHLRVQVDPKRGTNRLDEADAVDQTDR